MHDQDDFACRQCREAIDRAADLIDKTFPARRTIARRRLPEIPVGIAELGNKIVMPPSGPCAEILFAKGVLPDRIEPERGSGVAGTPGRAANRVSRRRQSRLERGKGRRIADIGRRIRTVDDATRAVDRGMTDQPEFCLGAHAQD